MMNTMKVFTPEIESNAEFGPIPAVAPEIESNEEFEPIPAVAPSCTPLEGMRKLSPATAPQERCSQQAAHGARLETPV